MFAIGSIIDFGYQDATIWGSGLLNNFAIENLKKAKFIGRKLDIRVVRGPYTKQLLERAGYQCPEKFGDPAVLMPMIYQPQTEKKYKVSVIQHIGGANEREIGDIHTISMVSDDYKGVIDSIVASEKIISSSLHGLILAESYGIPAIFVAKDTMSQLMKYYDWYESTGRREFKIASSYKQALTMEPTELPDLKKMQNLLLNEFPIDIYKE